MSMIGAGVMAVFGGVAAMAGVDCLGAGRTRRGVDQEQLHGGSWADHRRLRLRRQVTGLARALARSGALQ